MEKKEILAGLHDAIQRYLPEPGLLAGWVVVAEFVPHDEEGAPWLARISDTHMTSWKRKGMLLDAADDWAGDVPQA
jgi:hypothetical protein